MKFRLLLAFSILFCCTLLSAQETTIFPKHQISAGYMGSNITRPGAVISHYYKFWEADKTKTTKKGKIKSRLLELNMVNRAGFYNHKQNHLGAMLTTGVQINLIRKKGKFVSIGPQTGYFQRFLNEDTYIVNETGEVQRKHFSGTAQWTIGLQTRIGKDFSYNNPDNRFGWYLASNLLWSMPFGSGYINSSLIELGVFYSLKK